MDEIKTVCRELGKNLSNVKLQEAMDEMDGDGSGEVSLKEFERWWRRQLGARPLSALGRFRIMRMVRSCRGSVSCIAG